MHDKIDNLIMEIGALNVANDSDADSYLKARKCLEKFMRNVRNQAFEDAAQALGEIGADNLAGGIRALKDDARSEE